MNNSRKTALGISGALLGLFLFSGQAQAVPITGSLGLGGSYAPLPGPDLGTATSLDIISAFVIDADGVFAANGVTPGVSPVIHNDITTFVNPISITPLWSISGGAFEFDLTSINLDSQNALQINLSGSGTVRSNIAGLDDTAGSWVFTANNAGTSFTFSSSNTQIPEPSMLALLGLGLLGFAGSRRFSKKV